VYATSTTTVVVVVVLVLVLVQWSRRAHFMNFKNQIDIREILYCVNVKPFLVQECPESMAFLILRHLQPATAVC
jgi:hypothetical protein